MQNRRASREAALKAIYAVEVGKNQPQHAVKYIITSFLQGDTAAIKFAEKLLLITVDNASIFDETIDKHIKNWDVQRLAIVDKLILRMAISEFLFFDDVPTKVTINEAIELAKKYSTHKSGNFVNGILDAVLNQFRKDNKINKKGRGLMEASNH